MTITWVGRTPDWFSEGRSVGQGSESGTGTGTGTGPGTGTGTGTGTGAGTGTGSTHHHSPPEPDPELGIGLGLGLSLGLGLQMKNPTLSGTASASASPSPSPLESFNANANANAKAKAKAKANPEQSTSTGASSTCRAPGWGHRSMLSTGSVRTLGLKSTIAELGTPGSTWAPRTSPPGMDPSPLDRLKLKQNPNLGDDPNPNPNLKSDSDLDSDSASASASTRCSDSTHSNGHSNSAPNLNSAPCPAPKMTMNSAGHPSTNHPHPPTPRSSLPSIRPLPTHFDSGSPISLHPISPCPLLISSLPPPTLNRSRPILSLSTEQFPKIPSSFPHSIASIIREKRLQVASRNPSPIPHPVPLPLPSPTAPAFDSSLPDRPIRSRGNSRIGGLSELHCSTKFDSFRTPLTPILARQPAHLPPDPSHQAPNHPFSNPFGPIPSNALGEVVMTPTTEEWWSLAPANLCPLSRHRPAASPVAEEETPESDEDVAESDDSGPSSSASTDRYPPKPITPSQPHRLSVSPTCAGLQIGSPPDSGSPPPTPAPSSLAGELLQPGCAEPTLAKPTLTSVNGIIHMSPSSVAPDGAPMLSAMSSHSLGTEPVAILTTILDKAPRRCSLSHDGSVRRPADPRAYSAQTGQRTLESFVIHGSAGAGAYGFVKHAQEKGPEGEPVGPALMVKYIAKQKILADCWKRHKILGPIPVEIHVLDHLRRAPSRPSLVEHARTYVGARRARGETGALERVPRRSALQSVCKDARTGHAHICAILDYFEDPDYYYLVMPRFGTGKDLFAHIEQAPDGLERSEVERIFSQIVDAVLFLHERNIVHRDLKDENVVLDEDGNAQLIDFGSAAYVKEGKKFETFSGTLDFAAPEVLRGERHDGKEIDVWALGVMLYVLLSGECPFWNAEEAGCGIGAGSRAGRVLEERVLAGRVSREAMDLMEQCLCLDPRRRPGVEELCWHAFFVGEGGWRGVWPGWADDELVGQEDRVDQA